MSAYCPYHVSIKEANDAKHAATRAEFKAREARRVPVGLRRRRIWRGEAVREASR